MGRSALQICAQKNALREMTSLRAGSCGSRLRPVGRKMIDTARVLFSQACVRVCACFVITTRGHRYSATHAWRVWRLGWTAAVLAPCVFETWMQSLAVLLAPAVASPTRVACVGDSITAGYLASNASMAYPRRLQALLDARSPGAFVVSNFGAGGATVQKHTTNPYWTRDQFKQFMNGTWDVVVIMLGTNDAHEQPDVWPDECDAPDATAAGCSFMADYEALISAIKSRTIGQTPLVAVATPPPLMREGAYQMNQTVINDLLPALVPRIATASGLPEPIDVYTAMGGTARWRASFPTCGCAIDTGAPTDAIGSEYTMARGFTPQGGDYEVANLTYDEATAQCDEAGAACAGFTFAAGSSQPDEVTKMFLKRCHDRANGASGWWTWQKPVGALPPMPQSCALFCDTQSCDQCHPNDVGYAHVAAAVGDYILRHASQKHVSFPSTKAKRLTH